MSRSALLLLPLLVVGVAYLVQHVSGCNEAVCASMVSKCMLLKMCECDMQDKANCTCCKDCHKCLAMLYTECCSCVGMCPMPNPKSNLYKTSSVEDLPLPIPELFDVLTEEEDHLLRWVAYTYPAHQDLLQFSPKHSKGGKLEYKYIIEEETHGSNQKVEVSSAQNCTVAYMSQCMAVNKCKLSCESMGAAKYRWFHEYGCCECIGSRCLGYGKKDALCRQCPLPEEDDNTDSEFFEYEAVEENSAESAKITEDGGEEKENKEKEKEKEKEEKKEEVPVVAKEGAESPTSKDDGSMYKYNAKEKLEKELDSKTKYMFEDN